MKDLRADLHDLHRTLSQSLASGVGRSVMFMSARAGEGTSSVAASFALLAAEHARRAVWLVDLDLRRNHLFNSFAVGAFAQAFGGVGPPYSAMLKTEPFFTVEPEGPQADGGLGLFTAHRVGDTRLMVTQFDAARLKPSQSIRIRSQPDYWQTVRSVTDWTVVDAPALDLASVGLAIVSQVENVVIVLQADRTTPDEVDRLRQKITAHGGRVAGVVLNRRKADAAVADRLSL